MPTIYGVGPDGSPVAVQVDAEGRLLLAGNSATNLAYTASPTNGTVTSDTGTDALIPLADGTNAGLMAPAQHTKLAGVAAGAVALTSAQVIAGGMAPAAVTAGGGLLDANGNPISTGGSGSYPEALNFAALPASPAEGATYVVLQAQGIRFINRRPGGLYRFTSGAWVYLGEVPDGYFTDNVLRFFDNADPTKQLAFELAGITSGQTRTLTVPDTSGTISVLTTAQITAGAIAPAAVTSSGELLDAAGDPISTGGGGRTKTLAVFTPMTSQPPAAAFATLDTRNSVAVLDFDDATVEGATWVHEIPEGANLSSGIQVRVQWMATSATTGNVRWRAAFEASGSDLDTDSFDTAAEATGAANATSGIETETRITCTAIDGLTAGQRYRLRLQRVGTDGTNDTMVGDAELIAVELREAA